MRKSFPIACSAMLLAACGTNPESADDQAGIDHSQHGASAQSGDLSAAQQAYAEVNDRMHAAMADIPPDPDIAFMRGMLAHHRGAVEMSEVQLEHGTDPQARDLAERIIAAQQAEIDEMEAWLQEREEP